MRTKVRTTYLELGPKDEFLPKKGYRERLVVKEVENDIYLNFVFFAGVGLPWRWYSRLRWTIEEWEEYFSSGRVKTFLCFDSARLTGYYELEFDENNDTEIKFLGVFPRYLGKGLGGMLLSHAVDSARNCKAERIWLHTCTNDSDAALGNYIARGFRIFREEEGYEDVPGKDDLTELVSGFFNRYIERFNDTD